VVGCRVGDGAVIGAGAVAVKDVPDGAIALGVPARVVGYRPGWPAPSAA
jgi:acetyltransferase-like isoleucine patch superfamily enzyme